MKKNSANYCGVEKTLQILGSKWTALLLHHLFEGKKRFGQLQKSMPGISPKTLTLRLQELEKEKIITRKVFNEVPLHVEYTLTHKGKSFNGIIAKMAEWGDTH